MRFNAIWSSEWIFWGTVFYMLLFAIADEKHPYVLVVVVLPVLVLWICRGGMKATLLELSLYSFLLIGITHNVYFVLLGLFILTQSIFNFLDAEKNARKSEKNRD